jgi:phospholipid transport system substrate-binding protein
MRKIALRAPWAIGVALLAFACLAALPRDAIAEDAGAFIQNLGTEAIQVMGPGVAPAQRTARFRHLFDTDFDLAGAARFVLGPKGRELTPQQHEEFLTVFREFLSQAYSERLAQYAGEPFRVTGTRPQGDETIVTSEVVRRNGNPVLIDWHVTERDGRFLISDVDVDRVSMKVTQRTEFANIIQRNGGRADALLGALRQQIAQVPGPQSGSSRPRPGSSQPLPLPPGYH